MMPTVGHDFLCISRTIVILKNLTVIRNKNFYKVFFAYSVAHTTIRILTSVPWLSVWAFTISENVLESNKQCCGSGMFIPDKNFSIPYTGTKKFRILIRECKYFYPKNCF